MTNEEKLTTKEILTKDIALYDEKIAELKAKDSHARYDLESLSYSQGRRDDLVFVKMLLEDMKKELR
jgi:hypothetical protein